MHTNGGDKMISKEEAKIIAYEHIDGIILQESCTPYMMPSSNHPRSWIFDVYHRNQDKDTFHTIIEVTNKGVVAFWNKHHISDENDIDF